MYPRGNYIPPIIPQSPYDRRDEGEMYPIEPIQREVQSPQNQTPSLQITVIFEKEAPNTPIIKPTKESVRALAQWYRDNNMVPESHIPISGARIGNTEIPPLYSQEQDFDEEEFRSWADSVIGPSAITMSDDIQSGDNWNNIELDILRKVYGNLPLIEQTRALKENKDIKKGTIHNLNKMRLDQKLQEVLDERYGEPLEFREDIMTINSMIADEKENGNLSEEGIDYLFGAILWAHISKQNYKLTTVNNQPVVVTGDTTLDEQWKSTLETLHFGRKTGVPMFAKDNQPKIADYIAAYTYHNVDKNLTGHYSTLSQKVIGNSPDVTLTPQRIDSSTLSNEEKTFLTQWIGQDSRLGDIQTRQRDFVERAMENTRGKSSETLKRDMIRAPLTTLMQVSPMVGLAVGAAIIYGLVRAMVGEGKLSKFFGATAAILGGVAIVGNIGTVENLWRQNFGENFAKGIGQAPVNKTDTGAVVTNALNELPQFFREKWDSVSAVFTTSNDWSALMLDERIGPKIVDKYPTGALLAVLNPDPDNEFNEKWKGTPAQEAEIREILENLTGDERENLNTMLRETWNKYKMANKESLTNAQLKNGTIQVMIESLDTDYKWFNKVWRPAYWFDEASKEETLIEFTKNPTGWKNAKIGDLMTVWFPQRRDVRALNPLPPLLARIPSTEVVTLTNNLSSGNTPAGQNGKREKSVKATILKIWEANAPCDPELTLGQLLAKED